MPKVIRFDARAALVLEFRRRVCLPGHGVVYTTTRIVDEAEAAAAECVLWHELDPTD